MGTNISFKRPDGQETAGYFAQAARANAPGVVVIQEWWGVQDQIKGMADRLAAAGYDALAPDFYAGTVVPYHDRDAAGREMRSLNYLETTDNIVRGATRFLSLNGAKVGITGCCLGGAITILAAARVPELAAAACCYGLPPANSFEPTAIKIPFQAHFATHDDWCTPAAVDALENDLLTAGVNAEIHRYEAIHGFLNEQRSDVHNRAQAELAWGRLLAFFGEHLS